jgi:hypothetical protein
MRHRLSILLLFATAGILLPTTINAQVNTKDSLKLHLFYPSYAIHLPLGDMKERFGLSHSIGFGYSYLSKSRWMLNAEGNFLFGPNIKDLPSVLGGITTTDGYVINSEGTFGNLAITERGYTFLVRTGKLYRLGHRNPNSGIIVLAGGGFMQHKIRIDVSKNDVPQLRGDYKQGYDRMCNGPALSEFVGYQHLDNDKRLNFFIGLEAIQAWTADRRPYSCPAFRIE